MSQIFPDFKSSYVDFPMDKNALDIFLRRLIGIIHGMPEHTNVGICVFLSSTDQIQT